MLGFLCGSTTASASSCFLASAAHLHRISSKLADLRRRLTTASITLSGTAERTHVEHKASCVHVRHAFVGRLARQGVAVLKLFGLRNDCLHLCRQCWELKYNMQARHAPYKITCTGHLQRQKQHEYLADWSCKKSPPDPCSALETTLKCNGMLHRPRLLAAHSRRPWVRRTFSPGSSITWLHLQLSPKCELALRPIALLLPPRIACPGRGFDLAGPALRAHDVCCTAQQRLVVPDLIPDDLLITDERPRSSSKRQLRCGVKCVRLQFTRQRTCTRAHTAACLLVLPPQTRCAMQC